MSQADPTPHPAAGLSCGLHRHLGGAARHLPGHGDLLRGRGLPRRHLLPATARHPSAHRPAGPASGVGGFRPALLRGGLRRQDHREIRRQAAQAQQLHRDPAMGGACAAGRCAHHRASGIADGIGAFLASHGVWRCGGIELLVWGRRRGEAGTLPFGGWAPLESIKTGRWDRWQPRPVRLPLRAFMEKDIQGDSHWFELHSGQWVQGLVARNGGKQRVYVVTITPEMPEAVYAHWPRIITV